MQQGKTGERFAATHYRDQWFWVDDRDGVRSATRRRGRLKFEHELIDTGHV
jgi:hypothetical protein